MTSSVPNTSTEKSTVKTNPMVVVSKVVKTIAKKKKELLMKEDKVEYLQSLNGEEESKMSEEEKISMNVIRSADEDQEIVEESSEAILEGVAGSTTAKYSTEGIAITVMSDHPKTTDRRPVSTDKTAKSTISPTNDAIPSLESSDSELQAQENNTVTEERGNRTKSDLSRKERIKRELAELENLFEATMAALSREDISDPTAHRVAWRLRTKRADKAMEMMNTTTTGKMDSEACVVRNMTCVKFPSRRRCKGIALGR